MSAEETKSTEDKKTFKLNVAAPEFKFNLEASEFVPKQPEFTPSSNRYPGGGYNKPQNYYPQYGYNQQYGNRRPYKNQQPQQEQKEQKQQVQPEQKPASTKPQPSTPTLAAVVAASLGPTPAEAAAGKTSAPPQVVSQVTAVLNTKPLDVPDLKTVVAKGTAAAPAPQKEVVTPVVQKEAAVPVAEKSPTRQRIPPPPVAISAEESELLKKKFEELDKVEQSPKRQAASPSRTKPKEIVPAQEKAADVAAPKKVEVVETTSKPSKEVVQEPAVSSPKETLEKQFKKLEISDKSAEVVQKQTESVVTKQEDTVEATEKVKEATPEKTEAVPAPPKSTNYPVSFLVQLRSKYVSLLVMG
jgi:hypothetical protein